MTIYTFQYIRNQLNVIAGPIQIAELESNFVWNQFDEFALLVGIKRLPQETNNILKRRTLNTFTNLANSTYRGLINGITRELGLSLYYPITINPKKSPFTNKFYAKDPYVKIDESCIYLYSDYENNELECKIDRYEQGGNYEHLITLINFINLTSYFEASINDSYNPYIKSMTIINQTNRKQIEAENINSTKTKLEHNNLVSNSLMFNKHDAFKIRKNNLIEISRNGDYHVDCEKGIVTTYSQPTVGTAIRYQYLEYPFKPIASDIILHDLNKDDFKIKMFKQVLQDNGTYVNGLPTELGTDIINELMSVTPMYFGI